jgi:hypothetical protein
MKKLLLSGVIFSVLAFGFWGVSAAATNFAGTWVLDKGKSEGLNPGMANAESVTLTVTQDDKELTTKQEVKGGGGPGGGGGGMGMGGQAATYKLDGSETTSEMTGRMTGKATRKAKWSDGGKMLELNTVINGDMGGNSFTATTVDHWELAEGGKVLKIHRKSENPRGTQESKLVFNKQ